MSGRTGIRPVFIIGCQRSGTTMLAAQLARGRNVVALPEMLFLVDLLARADLSSPSAVARAHHDLIANFRFQTLGLPFSAQEFSEAAEAGGAVAVVLALVRKYLAHNGIEKTGPELVWVEHSPLHRDYVDLLCAHFPDARFIHIVRDPRAVYLSLKRHHRFNVWEPLALVRKWMPAVAVCHLHATDRPDRCIEVRYEDLLLDCEGTLRRCARFAGFEFDSAMLEGGGVKLPRFTRRQHALTAGPAQPERAEAWRKHINSRENDIIEFYCGAWMKHYGYLEKVRALKEPPLAEKAKLYLKSAVMTVYMRLFVRLHNALSRPTPSERTLGL